MATPISYVRYREDAQRIAYQLGYPVKVINKLKMAKSIIEVDRIMCQARHDASEKDIIFRDRRKTK